MQSRLGSTVEIVISTAIGFLIAMLTTYFVIPAFFHHTVSVQQNFGMTSVFTVVSLIRSYTLRRVFNRITVRRLNAARN